MLLSSGQMLCAKYWQKHDDGRNVYGRCELAKTAIGQALDSDSGQRLRPQCKEHCAVDKIGRQATRYPYSLYSPELNRIEVVTQD